MMEGSGSGAATTTPWAAAAGAFWDLTNWTPSTSSAAAAAGFSFPPTGGPHHQQLTCLKLGKRPYWCGGELEGGAVGEEGGGATPHLAGGGGGGGAAGGRKRDRPVAAGMVGAQAAVAVVARCQVEGCHVALAGAKEYHRRHKVCEPHSKAPKVVVHGVDQRFCQQCSRFHAIAEFDDAKRSCRRRLAGHNERRRKSSASEAMARGSAHPHGGTSVGHGFPYFPTSPARALSLLSSRAAPWLIPTSDLSSRSSTALDELIAENRAALMAWQLFSERSGWASAAATASGSRHPEMASWSLHPNQLPSQPNHLANGISHYHEAGGHVTLNLMQATAGASFRSVSDRGKSKDGDEDCSDIWKSLEGAHVV